METNEPLERIIKGRRVWTRQIEENKFLHLGLDGRVQGEKDYYLFGDLLSFDLGILTLSSEEDGRMGERKGDFANFADMRYARKIQLEEYEFLFNSINSEKTFLELSFEYMNTYLTSHVSQKDLDDLYSNVSEDDRKYFEEHKDDLMVAAKRHRSNEPCFDIEEARAKMSERRGVEFDQGRLTEAITGAQDNMSKMNSIEEDALGKTYEDMSKMNSEKPKEERRLRLVKAAPLKLVKEE
jgi:hypothetical protein